MNVLSLVFGYLIGMTVVSGALAQTPADPCRAVTAERPVHEALLKHFQVMEGIVAIAAYKVPVAAELYSAPVRQAVEDFNRRNDAACRSADGPMEGIPLFEGAHRTRLSRVGFGADAATAFAEITMIGDPEIGSSHYVVLRKLEDGWAVAKEEMYRMF